MRPSEIKSLVFANYPTRPQPTWKFAHELGLRAGDAHGLETILPEAEREEREARRQRERDDKFREGEIKWKEMDEIILSGEELDYTRFSKDQYMRRQRRLQEQGVVIPPRKRNPRRKSKR